jgi:hypothetical protein
VPDLDGAAIRSTVPRGLTQEISSWAYTQLVDDARLDGIAFESRHGTGLRLWALWERGDDGDRSAQLHDCATAAIARDDPDLLAACRIHHLKLH